MTISNDIMLSILAMDSYNRGYGEGVTGLGGLGSKIGNATIITDSETVQETATDGEALNFYAIAYDYGGETVISYRGTDDPLGELPNAGSGDLLSGWAIGAGFTQDTQTLLAEQFYEGVTGRTVFEQAAFIDQPVDILPKVTLTGHSLGGGLAGYIASLSVSAASASKVPG